MTTTKKMISVCIPCYNEEDNVDICYKSVTDVMKGLDKYDYEIVFRDNASTDKTYERLKRIAHNDYRVKIIENVANFGPGFRGNTYREYISGDVVVFVACDLQDPVELIPEFVNYYEQGDNIVIGQKICSGEPKIKWFLRHVFYKLICLLSDEKQYMHISGISLYSRKMYELFSDFAKFLPFRYFIASSRYPFRLVPYRQHARQRGESKLKTYDLFLYSIRALVMTSTKPIHIATVCGLFGSVICLIIGVAYLVKKLIYWDAFQIGIAPLIIGVFLIASLQLLFIGMIGEYIALIFDRVSPTPPSLVKETVNIQCCKQNDIGAVAPE